MSNSLSLDTHIYIFGLPIKSRVLSGDMNHEAHEENIQGSGGNNYKEKLKIRNSKHETYSKSKI